MVASFAHIRDHTFFVPLTTSRPVILDLGANRGEFARQMNDRYGATCYLVEANPRLVNELREEGRFPVWHCAVAGQQGQIRFHIAGNDECSSILTLPPESSHNCMLQDVVEVPARTLESILAEIRAPQIDLLKLDIEGAEVEVLAGLPKSALQTVKQITVEFHSDPSLGFVLPRDVEKVILRLRRHGFLCLDFTGQTRCDVLFINSAFHRISWLRRLWWEVRWNPPPWLLGAWQQLPASLRERVRPLLHRSRGKPSPPPIPLLEPATAGTK